MSESSLHCWLCVLVVLVGVLGLLHDSWPRRSHAFWIDAHALLGLLLWILALGRPWLSLTPPTLPLALWTRCLRVFLYALLVIMPIVGILALVGEGRAARESYEDIHAYLAYAAFILASFHILAMLWQRFIRRDSILRRIWWNS